MRERQQRKLAQLHALEPHANGMPPGTRLTLEFGIELIKRFIDSCEAAERRLGKE